MAEGVDKLTDLGVIGVVAEHLLHALRDAVVLCHGSGQPAWTNARFDALPAVLQEHVRSSAHRAASAFRTRRRLGPMAEGPVEFREELDIPAEAGAAGPGASLELLAVPVGVGGAGEGVEPPFVVIARDITADRHLRRRIDAVEAAGGDLVQLESRDIRNLDMIQRLQMLESRIVRTAGELLHFDHFAIRLLDEKSGKLELVIKHNLPPDYDAFDIFPRAEGNGISGYVAATGKPYISKDVLSDPLFLPGLHGARSSLTVPLKLHDKVIGILNVESQQVSAFGDDDRRLAEIFARYIAMGVHTLDLLVVERTVTNQAIVGRVASELAEPLQDICNEVDVLRSVAAGSEDLLPHIDKIRGDVEAIRQRVSEVAAGPTTLLGVERAMEDRRIDPVLGGRRVLVADDQSRIRRIIGDVLRNRGCEVVLCENGAQAIAEIEASFTGGRQPFDVIVSDIMMPDRNGYEVFSAVRARSATLPVILMTGFGYDPNHSIVRASEEGLQSVLFKPFQVEQMVELVKKVLPPR